MKLPIILLAAVAAAPAVYSQIFYTEDFSGAVGGEWSNTTTSTTPIGARPFLGEFGNTSVSLDLSGLPAHTTATISFDLFVIRSWDGNDLGSGPDRWKISVGDSGSQTEQLDATFANHDPSSSLQSYPDTFLSGNSHPNHTGAAEINTLGYSFGGPQRNTVYNLSFTIPHTATDFRAVFESSALEAIATESWGIANVSVSTSAVPEPGEYAAVFGLGLAGFAVWRRHSRKLASGAIQAA